MSNVLLQTYYVAWGDIMFLKHNFLNILVMSVMTPLLYLIAFGYGLRSGSTDIGVSYVAFVIPGIVALSSLSSSFASTSTRLNVQRLYYKSFDEMMLCPLSLTAIILGKSTLGLIRGLISCFIMYALGLFLAPELSLNPLLIVMVVMSCVTFSMLGLMAAMLAKSHQSMATFNSLVILPMTFLCGTFFSVSSLDPIFQGILYCLPLTHSSLAIRSAALPDYLDFEWVSALVMVCFMVVFFLINYYLLKTRKFRSAHEVVGDGVGYPHGVLSDFAPQHKDADPGLLRLLQRLPELGVGGVIRGEGSHVRHLDDECRVGLVALPHASHEPPDVLPAPFRGGIREPAAAVGFQGHAFYLDEDPPLPGFYVEIESGIPVGMLWVHRGMFPEEAGFQDVLAEGPVRGLRVDVDQQVAFVCRDEVVRGLPALERPCKDHCGPWDQYLPAAAGVLHMDRLDAAVHLHLRYESVGAADESPAFDLLVVHVSTQRF